MRGMRPALRSPFLSLTALLLLVPLVVLVGGCSSDADPDGDGPAVTATGPHESTDPTAGADDTESPDQPTDGTTTADELPDAVAAVCAPYSLMVSAIQEAATSSTDPDAIAAEIAPVMKEFAAQVPDLERPPGMSAATWRGIEALAAEIVALPDAPTRADIEAVEDRLSPQERAGVEDAQEWFRENCA
jgi:hypothetical protein